ncbi:MAG TPA: hypothetical protein VIF15_13590 [Polyangiaceae bacterium]|jgi:hypothetical protein
MKTSAIVVVCLVSANTLVAGWAFLRSGAHSTASSQPPIAAIEDRPVPPTPSAAGPDPDRLASTDQRVQALERTLSQIQSDAGATPGPGAQRSSGPVLDPEGEALEQERRRQELEAFVSQQRRDAQWAPGYEKRLEALAKGSKDTDVKQDRCFASVCRLELEHSSDQNRIAFLQGFQRDLANQGDAAAMLFEPVVGDDGKPATVVHVFRAGYPLPEL